MGRTVRAGSAEQEGTGQAGKFRGLGLMVSPFHSCQLSPHALTPPLAAAGSLVSSPLAQGIRALSLWPF